MSNTPQPGPFAAFGLPGFEPSDATTNPSMGGLDFVRALWGGASTAAMPGLAGFVAPTLDIEELDRKIKDLRSVHSWLETHASMLRATIQALEVQRNTIAMLRSFGAPDSAAAAADPMTASRGASKGLPPGWPTSPTSASSARAEPSNASKAAPSQDASTAKESTESAPKPATVEPNPSIANAAAWWSSLQEQFAQVASAALRASASSTSIDHGPRGAPEKSTARAVNEPARKTSGTKVERTHKRKPVPATKVAPATHGAADRSAKRKR